MMIFTAHLLPACRVSLGTGVFEGGDELSQMPVGDPPQFADLDAAKLARAVSPASATA
jgi:hypothetical protein